MDFVDCFGLLVVFFIDIQGVYFGLEVEECGQGWVIVESIQCMVCLWVFVVCVVIGEGGLGGVLVIGVGNWVLIQENVWYLVIFFEGVVSIFWCDVVQVFFVVEVLCVIVVDLLDMGIVEEVVFELFGGVYLDMDVVVEVLGSVISCYLDDLLVLMFDDLFVQWVVCFCLLGVFEEC